jgi:hypothetical protein
LVGDKVFGQGKAAGGGNQAEFQSQNSVGYQNDQDADMEDSENENDGGVYI